MRDLAAAVRKLEAAEQSRPSVLEARRRVQVARAAATEKRAIHDSARQALDEARGRLRELEAGRGRLLAEFKGGRVYEFWLEVPGYAGPIRGATAQYTQHGDIHQVSNVTGTTKSGLGGAVVGGLLLGPVGAIAGMAATRKNTVATQVRTVDTRRFELQITGPGYAWSTMDGPHAETLFRQVRDCVNARGSSPDSVQAFALAQRDTVARHASAVAETSAVADAALAVLGQEEAAYGRAWTDYASLRLPVLEDLRARWHRSSWFARLPAIAIGPMLLIVWATCAVLAARAVHVAMRPTAWSVGILQIAVVVSLAVFYVRRVRLRR